MNWIDFNMVRGGTAALTLALSVTAAALEVAWYQQNEPGNASGEMRLENLAEGGLEIETPGRKMEFGIMRVGDVAIVTLAEPAGRSGRKGGLSPELVVVARQGAASTRAIWPLAVPEPTRPEPAPTAATVLPGDGGPAAAEAMQPRFSEKSVREVTPPAPENAPTNPVSPPAAKLLRPNPVSEGGTLPESPAVASPPGGLRLAGIDPRPAGPLACPVIAIRPGSLKDNIARLLAECGARMGDWITGGEDRKYLKDWIVREPRILADRNRDGLHGLLELLYAEYRLQGLPSPDASAIDIYRIVNASTGEVE